MALFIFNLFSCDTAGKTWKANAKIFYPVKVETEAHSQFKRQFHSTSLTALLCIFF